MPQQRTFVALYRGTTIKSARLIAVSADPELVADVTARLLDEPRRDEEDEVLRSLEDGRRRVLRAARRVARREVTKAGDDAPS